MNNSLKNSLEKDIIDSFVNNILFQILIDNDAEDYDNGDIFQSVNNFFNDCNYSQIEREDKIKNIWEEDVFDNVVNGNGEYWKEEYNIYNLENYLNGDEFEKSINIILNYFGI